MAASGSGSLPSLFSLLEHEARAIAREKSKNSKNCLRLNLFTLALSADASVRAAGKRRRCGR
jgi:hypothetical protein